MAWTDLGVDARDAGGIVLGWLTKVAVVLAVIGIICFDAISIVTTRLSVEDQGAQAALSASDTWSRTHDVREALKSAEQSASEANPLNSVDASAFRIDPDGTVHVRVSREASTLVAHHVKPLHDLTVVHADTFGRSGA